MGNTDKVVEYIRECNALNIKVLKPDINKSFAKFSVEDNNIRFGLAAVKNVGVNIINNIVIEREQNGEFTDFINLIKRLDSKDINKRVIESLIKCGGFDEMGYNRACLLYTSVLSFGFKHGIPKDSDLVFDVRFLPNPYYLESLRNKTGDDQEVRDCLLYTSRCV